ncbi:MAG: BamA/TamA family outer membrane protein [Rhodothermaceae bacterium]|nr:BamA/TamA family outer membrane protein [Rhodothermaceae bacterium]
MIRWTPRRNAVLHHGVSLVLALLLIPAVLGQAPEAAVDTVGTPRLVEVRLIGDRLPTLTRQELRDQLRTRPNRRFLGIPGVTPALWIYRLGGGGEGAVARSLRRAGEPPTFYEAPVVQADAERLMSLFRQEGFRAAVVATRIDTLAVPEDAPPRLRVTFDVTAGPPTYLRSVRYEGIDALTREEREALVESTTLSLQPDKAGTLRFRAKGHRFSERELLGERRAVIDFLRARGFARVTRDSVRAVIFGMPDGAVNGVPPDSVDVAFRIRPGSRFRFGDLSVVVSGTEVEAPTRTDTMAVGDGLVTTRIAGESRVSPNLLRRSLRVEPGQPYDQEALLETKRRLERTGLFAFSEIVSLAPDTADAGLPRLPHRITLRTRKRHSVRLEGFVLQRTGLLGTETEELALGAGASYRTLNLFGGGEVLTLRTTGSVAGDFAAGFPTAQAEIGATLTAPRLVVPFGGLEQVLRPYDARTRLALGFLTARRQALGVIVRGRASLGFRLEVQHTPSLTSLMDLVDFGLSDPDTLDGFSARFLSFVDDPVTRRFILEDYTSPQINNAVRYTIRNVTADPFRRARGHAVEAAIETGGQVSALLDRFVFTPDSIEGSLPGLPLFGGDASNRLEYRPYLRAQLDARRYLPRGRTTLALKIIVGVAHPIGETPVVPFDRRFYAGGASSVRGWRLRTLGPGAVDADGAFVQGGEVKLEVSGELRYVVLRNVLSANWQVVTFADAGNTWFGPRNPGEEAGQFRFDRFYRELGLGAGTGLRIGWDYLILRFDLAWQVRSPIPEQSLFPEGLDRPLLHFGIGQAF